PPRSFEHIALVGAGPRFLALAGIRSLSWAHQLRSIEARNCGRAPSISWWILCSSPRRLVESFDTRRASIRQHANLEQCSRLDEQEAVNDADAIHSSYPCRPVPGPAGNASRRYVLSTAAAHPPQIGHFAR